MSAQPPLPNPSVFARHLLRNAAIGAALVAASLGIGVLGYHEFVGLGWLDATLNASMILTGMGPIAPLTTVPAKIFGILFSLFSGVAFLSFAAVLLGPVARRFLHRFHLELYSREGDG
jgi:hypothetical protein